MGNFHQIEPIEQKFSHKKNYEYLTEREEKSFSNFSLNDLFQKYIFLLAVC